MGRHHLVLLSHPESHKAQCLDLFCSWYRSMTLSSRVSAPVRLFADDCLLYSVIWHQQDAASLQTDLNHLQEWVREWQMVFNPDKCEHTRITNKRKVIQTSYNIHGQTLNETSKAKYLGVTIDNTLSLNSHIDIVTKKANQTTAFLRRNLSSCPKDVKAKVHSSSTTWICFDGMGLCNKIQHSKSGICTEACRQVLLQWLPPNQQCHFNAARTCLGGPSVKAVWRITTEITEITSKM